MKEASNEKIKKTDYSRKIFRLTFQKIKKSCKEASNEKKSHNRLKVKLRNTRPTLVG